MQYRILFGVKEDRRAVIEPILRETDFSFHMAPLDKADLGSFDAVIPLTLPDQAILRRRRAAGEVFCSLLPDAATENLCHDKKALNLALIRAGFDRYIPNMLDSLPEDPARYPVVVKKFRDEWGKNTRIIRTGDALPGFDAENEFLQECVPGADEYATHLLVSNGKICFEQTVRYTMGAELLVKGKYAHAKDAKWQNETPDLQLFQQMLDAIGFADGICCIDYRRIDGVVQLFEINPRFGASLARKVDSLLQAYLNALGHNRHTAQMLAG
ncbi:MAG: hypothetical protein U5N10_03735 [Gemmobacter sp.]|nr:hypothetical protein [Gemmobacter sp.]